MHDDSRWVEAVIWLVFLAVMAACWGGFVAIGTHLADEVAATEGRVPD